MGTTVYKVQVKAVDGSELFSQEIKYSSLLAFIMLGFQLYKLRKNEKLPAVGSIERIQLG